MFLGDSEHFQFYCTRYPGSEYLCQETKIYSALDPATYSLPLYYSGWDIRCLATDMWACLNVEINFANSDYDCLLMYTDPGWDYCGLATNQPTTTTTPAPDTTFAIGNITQTNAVCRSITVYGGAYVPMHYCHVNQLGGTGGVMSYQWLCNYPNQDRVLVAMYSNGDCSGTPLQTQDYTAFYSSYPTGFDCMSDICPPELVTTVTKRQCTSCLNENCVETGDYEVQHFVTDHCIASNISNDANSFQIICEDSVGMSAQQYFDDSCGIESDIFPNSSFPYQGCQNETGPFVDIVCANGTTTTTMTPATTSTTSTGPSAVCDVVTYENTAYPMYYCQSDNSISYEFVCDANNDAIMRMYTSTDCTGTPYNELTLSTFDAPGSNAMLLSILAHPLQRSDQLQSDFWMVYKHISENEQSCHVHCHV